MRNRCLDQLCRDDYITCCHLETIITRGHSGVTLLLNLDDYALTTTTESYKNEMSGMLRTSSWLVAVVYSLRLASSSLERSFFSWHSFSHASRLASRLLSNSDLSAASCSIIASPSAISRLPTTSTKYVLWIRNCQVLLHMRQAAQYNLSAESNQNVDLKQKSVEFRNKF